MLQVVEVDGRRSGAFVSLPRRIYRESDSRWVPTFDLLQKQMMGKLGQPEKRLLLALVDGEPVARLGAKVHRHGDYEGLHFGFFECMEGHAEAAARLVEEAHKLRPDLPMRGPFQFRQEDPFTGLLVEGFEDDPYFLMGYNPPYYSAYLEQAGLKKIKDLYTYQYEYGKVRYDCMDSRAKRARDRGIEVRNLDPSRLREEVEKIAVIFNDALATNWGFEPIEGDQLEDMWTLAKFFLLPKGVWFARHNGEDIGCAIVLPNYNPMIKACNGKIRPGLIWHYLRREKYIDTFRGYALGVRSSYRVHEATSVLVDAIMREAERSKWKSVEVSWVLEDNTPMNAMARALGGRRNKIYRVLERPPQ